MKSLRKDKRKSKPFKDVQVIMKTRLFLTETKFYRIFPKVSHVKEWGKRNKKPVWYMDRVVWKVQVEAG